MRLEKYCFDGSKKPDLKLLPASGREDGADKKQIIRKTADNQTRMQKLQDRLYADGREGLIILLQAMDAAGKDSIVKHVIGGMNPQGVDVYSFKQPSREELAHDFLWRTSKCLPRYGKIAIFNRSYYEDVLVVQVHQMNRSYRMAERIISQSDRQFFEKRYGHIRSYEQYLFENSYRIVKIFFNVSKEKQKERFLERIDMPEKNWKFSHSDLKERAMWEEYQSVYEEVIFKTATKNCPWYVIPADQKWYARYLVSEAILKTLREMNPQYPAMPEEEKRLLSECRQALLGGK